jgi:hypothetical protein
MNASTPPAIQVNDRQTWLSFFLGFAVWFLHLNIVYPVTSLACKWGWFSFDDAGATNLRIVQIAITIIAAVVLIILIYLPWRNWHAFQTDSSETLRQTERDRRPLMGFVTMLLNSLLLLFVITSIVPVLALNPCG